AALPGSPPPPAVQGFDLSVGEPLRAQPGPKEAREVAAQREGRFDPSSGINRISFGMLPAHFQESFRGNRALFVRPGAHGPDILTNSRGLTADRAVACATQDRPLQPGWLQSTSDAVLVSITSSVMPRTTLN